MSHYCTYCGSHSHNAVLCPKTAAGSSARSNLRCTYCGGNDHSIAACKKTYSGNAAMAWNQAAVSDYFAKDIK